MSTLAKIQLIPNYVAELRTQTGYYLQWIPNEYADQVSADNFYEVLRKDVEIARCLHLLSLMTAGETTTVECDDERLAELSTFILRQIKDFIHARKSLVEKAVLFGCGIQRKYYRRVFYQDRYWQMPYRLAEVDRRRLRIERDEEDKTVLYWTIWCPKIDQYIMLEDRSINANAPDGCGVQDYVWYMHMAEEMSPYFEGFGETLYTLAYIKSKVVQYWADLCESWSKPFLVAQVDLMKATIDATLGTTGFPTAESRVNALIETFEKCRGRHIAVVDAGDKLQWFEHGSTGANIIRELLEYCDKKIQLLILGAELSTTAGGVGSYALGAVHKAQTDTVVIYNRLRLAEVLVDDLLYDFYYRNQGQLRSLDIEFPNPGDVRIKIEVAGQPPNPQQQTPPGMPGQEPARQPKTMEQPQGAPRQ